MLGHQYCAYCDDNYNPDGIASLFIEGACRTAVTLTAAMVGGLATSFVARLEFSLWRPIG